jgi:hypothetical protein
MIGLGIPCFPGVDHETEFGFHFLGCLEVVVQGSFHFGSLRSKGFHLAEKATGFPGLYWVFRHSFDKTFEDLLENSMPKNGQ